MSELIPVGGADEAQFLRDLVKASRQRIHHIKWTDRDGSARLSALTSAEASRLNGLAHARKISAAEVLRQAAHVPLKDAPKA